MVYDRAGAKSWSAKRLPKRYPGTRIGRKLQFGRGEWEIVGVMSRATRP